MLLAQSFAELVIAAGVAGFSIAQLGRLALQWNGLHAKCRAEARYQDNLFHETTDDWRKACSDLRVKLACARIRLDEAGIKLAGDDELLPVGPRSLRAGRKRR